MKPISRRAPSAGRVSRTFAKGFSGELQVYHQTCRPRRRATLDISPVLQARLQGEPPRVARHPSLGKVAQDDLMRPRGKPVHGDAQSLDAGPVRGLPEAIAGPVPAGGAQTREVGYLGAISGAHLHSHPWLGALDGQPPIRLRVQPGDHTGLGVGGEGHEAHQRAGRPSVRCAGAPPGTGHPAGRPLEAAERRQRTGREDIPISRVRSSLHPVRPCELGAAHRGSPDVFVREVDEADWGRPGLGRDSPTAGL